MFSRIKRPCLSCLLCRHFSNSSSQFPFKNYEVSKFDKYNSADDDSIASLPPPRRKTLFDNKSRRASIRRSKHEWKNKSQNVNTDLNLADFMEEVLLTSSDKSLSPKKDTFHDLNLPPLLVQALQKRPLPIITPTEIQAKSFNEQMNDNNVVFIHAPTGTGKTLSFLLPLLARLQQEVEQQKSNQTENTRDRGSIQAVIMLPSRELVHQITEEIQSLTSNFPIIPGGWVDSVRGGDSLKVDLVRLRNPPAILVGSAKKLQTLFNPNLPHFSSAPSLQDLHTVIVDEADKIFAPLSKHASQGRKKLRNQAPRPGLKFLQQITELTNDFEHNPFKFVCVSATLNARLRSDLLKSNFSWWDQPVSISIAPPMSLPPQLKHYYVISPSRSITDKCQTLRWVFHQLECKNALLFVDKYKPMLKPLKILSQLELSVEALHEPLNDNPVVRQDFLKSLERGGSEGVQLAVATEETARGLDFPGLEHVFISAGTCLGDPRTYLHLAGRTARNGLPGSVISIVPEHELPLIRKLEAWLDITMEEIE